VGIEPIARGSSVDAVRTQLVELIQNGEFAVGARLPSEHELARSFGVSRPVIRESLGGLRSAGLIESRAGAGTFVTARNPTTPGLLLLGRYDTNHLHEVRQHLEIPGAGLAALRRSESQLAELHEIVDRTRDEHDVVNWVRDDLEFHVAIAAATGNELQVRLVRDLRELQFEQTVAMARALGGLAAPDTEHGAIVAAIHERDAAGAERAMAAHLDGIQQRVRGITTGGTTTSDTTSGSTTSGSTTSGSTTTDGEQR
jgi:DNA-binding FadR family transcriptional regulator